MLTTSADATDSLSDITLPEETLSVTACDESYLQKFLLFETTFIEVVLVATSNPAQAVKKLRDVDEAMTQSFI